jgi:hypothetical protein
MVASSETIAERFTEAPKPFSEGRWLLPRFTCSDVDTLVQQGIIPEDASTELLDGLIVLKDRAATGANPYMIGREHRICVEQFSSLRKVIDNSDRHIETQQPLVCSETHRPEPDVLILRGTIKDYPDHAKAEDAFCIIEVADSSYERDVGGKLQWYARGGVVQYIVVNLRSRTAEVYANPDTIAGTYPPPHIVMESQTLQLRVGEAEYFPVLLSEVLP